MSSPIFQAMGGGKAQSNGPMQMLQEFKRFKQQMGNINPQEKMNELLQSGKVTQDQINQAQQMAQMSQSLFQGLF